MYKVNRSTQSPVEVVAEGPPSKAAKLTVGHFDRLAVLEVRTAVGKRYILRYERPFRRHPEMGVSV